MAKKYQRKTIDKATKGNVKFIQMSKEYSAPIVQVEANYKIVRYGENNNFPNQLLELLSSSGLHRSIIDKKVQMIMGEGLNLEDVNDVTEQFILHPNPYEDLNSLMEKCAWDLETFGSFYLQVIWNPNDNTVKEVYHMKNDRMRVGIPNDFGFSDSAYFYNDLTLKVNDYYDIQNTIHFPMFSENVDKSEPQIFHVKKYSPTNQYYGSPSYEGSVLDIQTYAEISNFHNSNLHNNFSPGYLIAFNGTPPSEELQDDIIKELRTKYGDTENTGKPLVMFLEEGMEWELKPMEQSDIDNQFKTLIKQIIENITISHKIPKQVLGIQTQGSLGGSKEVLEATQIFKTDYIMPQQSIILGAFNTIGLLNGLDEFKINNPSPNIMMYDIADLGNILTQNELREYLGYEELDDSEIVNEQEDEIIIDEKINNEEDGK